MTEKEMIAAWEKQQESIKYLVGDKRKKDPLNRWMAKPIDNPTLSKEESLRIARMIDPNYEPKEEEEKQPTREEMSSFAAMIDQDTKAILLHPELQPQAAMEREAFMRK